MNRYSTKKQEDSYWKVSDLADGPSALSSFYSCSKFYIYKDVMFVGGGNPIQFPNCIFTFPFSLQKYAYNN